MVAGTSSRFACEGCGKSLVWKAAQAGKKVRCSCGTVMVVPQAPHSGAKPAIPGSLIPPPPIAQAAPAPTLGYVSARPKRRATEALPTDKLIDPVRDIYVPTALLVIGFLLIGLWGLVGRGINAQMSMLVLAASCVSTMIKTIVLVLVCVAITAKHGDVSFGMLWPAVLKFSSIILINDAMLNWFEAWQIYRGAIEVRHNVMYIDIWLLVWEMFMASFLVGILLWYLFDIEKEQMFWMGAAIAFASMAVGFGLRFAVVWGINTFTAAAAPAPAATPTPAPSPPSQSSPAAPAPAAPNGSRQRSEMQLKGDQALAALVFCPSRL